VRRDFGAEATNRVARRLVVPAHRDGGQPQVIERPVPAEREGKRLSPLLDHMRRHLDHDHAQRDLADRMQKNTASAPSTIQVIVGA
jgi:AraC family transcriptional activator FtrA